jgi:hypothetical protein
VFKKYFGAKIFSLFLLGLVFLAPTVSRAQNTAVSNGLMGAIFGTAYLAFFDSKEVDFYGGQIFYDKAPKGFKYFDTYSTTFGSDLTLFHQKPFNWFIGTERIGRSGSGTLNNKNIQWNIPVCALYAGARFDLEEKNVLNPYFFCIGGAYAMTDLLGADFIFYNNNFNYNVNGTTLGLELGMGFTPLTLGQLEISLEGNYRFANFANVSYSGNSTATGSLPTGLPTSIDYSGWSVDLSLTFDPKEKKDTKPEDAREKLLAGQVHYDKSTFMAAAKSCDIYLVKLFLDSGFQLEPDDVTSITGNDSICEKIKDEVQKAADKKSHKGKEED